MGGFGRFAPAAMIVAAMAVTLIAMDGSSPGTPAGIATAIEPAAERSGHDHSQHDHAAATPGSPAGATGSTAASPTHDGPEHSHTQLAAADVDRYIGDEVRPLSGEQAGLYAVTLPDGEQLVTHGPDLHLADGELPPPSSERRPPVCVQASAQHVLYGRPAGAPDRTAEVVGQIRDEIARMNAVLNRDSLASGGPVADYRVLCDGAGQVRVDSFVNPGDASFSSVVGAARAAGFNRGDVNYTVFYDASNGCGIGSIYSDDRLAADNWNNRGGGYGIAYAGCWQGVPMHESAHNMGAVQYGAPHSTGSGAHCADEWDVMCYRDGGDRNQTMSTVCSDVERFDCGNDDYFDSAPEPGEYLATHWNLGSPLNRFIAFDGQVSAPDPDPSTAVLVPGTPVKGRTGRPRSVRYYKVEVPAGRSSLTVSLDGPSNRAGKAASRKRARSAGKRKARKAKRASVPDLDLRTRHGAAPGAADSVCPPLPSRSDESCSITNPTPGWWYVAVELFRGKGKQPFRLTAELG
jgi:Bacterial pre-peptidase C-terminal domain